MDFYELLTDAVFRTIICIFSIYSYFAKFLLKVFHPVAKYFTDKKLISYGIALHPEPGVLGISVINPGKFYTRLPTEGTFGFLEGYLDGDWETEDFYSVIRQIFESRRLTEIASPIGWVLKRLNLQTKSKIWDVAHEHYDGG